MKIIIYYGASEKLFNDQQMKFPKESHETPSERLNFGRHVHECQRKFRQTVRSWEALPTKPHHFFVHFDKFGHQRFDVKNAIWTGEKTVPSGML